jgi:hypothetical protein
VQIDLQTLVKTLMMEMFVERNGRYEFELVESNDNNNSVENLSEEELQNIIRDGIKEAKDSEKPENKE